MVERVLTDAALRERLVAEASEHVLSFDWGEIAAQTARLYTDLLDRPRKAPGEDFELADPPDGGIGQLGA